MKKLFTFFFALIVGIGTMIASEYSTIADLYNMAQDSAFTLGAFDVVYVPSFQNGSNMYIKDNTGSMVIYKRNYGLQAGDHVEAGLQGKISIYYGLYEIAPVSTKEELTVTSGEAPAPKEATELPSANNVSQFVVYKNVSFTADTAFVSNTRHAVYGIWNNQRITFYNQYYIGATLSADKTYNITAVNTIYNTTPQAYPLLVEEVIGGTPASPELCIVDSGTCGENLTWKLSCDNVLTISGTGDMTDWSSYSDVAWYSYRKDITSVTIPNSVTSIGNYAFDDCSSLKSVTIPNSVTSIGNSAFYYCDALTSVTIPSSVTSIGEFAFYNCSGLTSVTVPNSFTSIGYAAFAGCSNLTEINVAADHPYYCSVDGILFNKNQTTIVQYPGGKSGAYSIPSSVTNIEDWAFYNCSGLTSITIPNSVTSIGSRAFYGCSGLTSIEIPNSVTSIGVWAFALCKGLTSVTIPNSVTSIEADAFLSCDSLTSIEIPNSVTSIGYGAFSGCLGLTSVTIPNNVTSIGKGAFSACSGLTSITCEATTPPTCGQRVFNNVDKSIPLYVPAESVYAYLTADQWSEFTNIQSLPAQECAPVSTTHGYLEHFNNYPSGTTYDTAYQAPCWTVGNANPNAPTTYIPFIYANSTYSITNSNSYRIYSNATYGPAWIATPEIKCENLSEKLVRFYMGASTSYWWICGVMTDPEDISTFVALDSVKGIGKATEYQYDLSEYAAMIPEGAKYFAWRTPYGLSSTAFLDDLSIYDITCTLPKPSAQNITYNSARIYSGLQENLNWYISIAKVSDSVTIVYEGQQDAFDKYKLITGLEENSEYEVDVMSMCDAGSSVWMYFHFKTLCKAITPEALGTITFSADEGYVAGSGASRYLPCWTVGNKYGFEGNRIPYIYNTSGNYWHNGNRSLEFYTTAAQNGAYAIMPPLDMDDIKNYQVNFWGTAWSSSGQNQRQLIVGVITDPDDLNTFTAIDTVTMETAPSWLPFTIPFDKYKGDYLGNQGKYVMFLSEFDINNDVLITEVSVEHISSCPKVTEFTVDSIGEDMAVISWDQYSPSYRVMVSDTEVEDDAKEGYPWLQEMVVTNTEHVVISDLNYSTQYYIYARALCGGGDSSEISVAYAKFLTDCPSEGYWMPFYDHFENSPKTGTGNKPLCWDGVQLTFDTVGTTQNHPYVYASASYAMTGTNSLYLYSYGSSSSDIKSIAVAPKVYGDLNEYMVRFYARKSSSTVQYGNKLTVGYVTDFTQQGMNSTFVKIADVEVESTEYDLYEVIIGEHINNIPAGARVALKADWSIQDVTNSTKYAAFYIDNFEITYTPTCFAPKVEVISTSLYSAELRIIPAREADHKWQVTYHVYDSIEIGEYIVDADSTHVVITGLTPGTRYWFFARTVCGGEAGTSYWYEQGVEAYTKFYFDDSYSFGFEKEEGWKFCQGSTSSTYYINPALEVGYEGGSATTAYTNYYPFSRENTSSYIYAYGPANGSLGTGALMWQSSSNYWGGYVVFPSVVNPKDRSFEFKARSGYLSASTMKPSTSYDQTVEIGTIDKNKGFDTYNVLTTFDLKKLDANTVASEENDWLWSSYTIDLDSATVANKQIVLRMPKPNSSAYLYIDNVTLGAPKGFGYVSLKKIRTVTDTVNIEWDNTGGPWNLSIRNMRNEVVKQFFGLTTTSMTITDLASNTEFTAVLESANAPANTSYPVTSTQTFKTMCAPLIADNNHVFFWNFDDPNDTEPNDILAGAATDTAYLKPSCFTTATNYTGAYSNGNQWLWQTKGHDYYSTLGNPSDTYNHREIGYGDSYGSLRVFTTSTYVSETTKTWIALPKLDCGLDTMMIEFWGRCLANQDETASSNAGKVISTTYLGASYSKSLVIGTLTDPKDFSTLQILDTVTYVAPEGISTSTLVSSDTTGNRYWQKMQLPLKGAKGDYIVLFQPGPGLFFVDNLKIKPAYGTLFAPDHTETTDITTNGATLRWEVRHAEFPSVVVVKDAYEEVLVRQTIPAGVTSYMLENLMPATHYKWYVYQINGDTESLPSATNDFYTECLAITPDYKSGFELEDGWKLVPGTTSDTYKQTMCWTYENAGPNAVGTYIYNYVNGSSSYSHSGEYALRLYAYSETYQTYAAMPEMTDVSAYDTLQVNFWMRPAYANASTGRITTQYTLGSTASTAEYYYAKSVIVGTMTDPNDASTFVPIDTITYDGTLSTSTDTATAANDYLFQRKSVKLAGAKGKHVAFMATLWAKGAENKSTYDYMWIDDISFSGINPCNNSVAVEETYATICAGETYFWNGQNYYISGVYRHTIPHVGFDCDSVIQVLNLTVQETMFMPLEPATICAGESYYWKGRVLTQSGSYADTILSSAGCDSVIEMLTLEVLPQKFMLLFDTICEGNYIWFNGTPLYESGTYTATLPSVNGCDSIVNLTLTVLPPARGEEWYAACESFTWPFNGLTYYTSGDYSDTLLGGAYNGCDTIVTLHLTIYQPTYGEISAVACEQFTWSMNGKTFYTSGDYVDTLHSGNVYGCDSIIILHLTINQPTYGEEYITACDSYYWNDRMCTESGDYRFNTTNAAGCDSTAFLHLNIVKSTASEEWYTACGNFTWNGITYTESGDYQYFTTNVAGCDSVATLHLTIYQPTYGDTTAYECDSYEWHGQTYYESGDYQHTYWNRFGCDSIVTLHLTIYSPVFNREVVATCGGEPYVWHGRVISNTGVYYDTLTTVYGCDSICMLELSFYPNSQTEMTVVECGAYTWNGITYTESGDYEYVTQNAFGCDSVVTLHLTIIKAERQFIQHDTLSLYQATDYPFNEPGEYTWNDTVRYVSGCDSLITTHVLVILPTPTYTITCTAEHGSIAGPTTAEYMSEVTLQAIPNYGYHFVRWSDGNTSNPRRFNITEDVSFTALFVVDRMGSCGDNNDLTWMYDANARSLTITGEGALNSNYTYGVEAPGNIEKLVVAEGITSIGAGAFKNETNLVIMTLCSTLQAVGDSAFAGCKRLEEITLYAERVPDLSASGYANVGNKKYIYLYVPEGRERAYQRDTYWSEFDIQVKGAETVTEPIEDVTVEPTANTAEITWPAVADASTYSIEISKDGVVICKLTFNAMGQLTGIAFAANRTGAEYTQEEQVTGFRFTVTSLDSNTTYGYTVASKDASNTVVDTKTGTFTTEKNDVPTDIDEVIQEPKAKSQKLLIDGQLFILHGDKIYTATGQELK